MKVQKTEGLILRVIDYQETDRIVSFYTRDFGKISALARHAVKSKRRFGTQLNVFQLVQLEFRQKPQRSLVFLEQVKPLVSLAGIYQDWRCITVACVIADLVGEMTREGSMNPTIYDVAAQALRQLHQGDAWPRVLAQFQYALLTASGFKPAIDQCAACHTQWDPKEETYWVQGAGGMHCVRCLPRHSVFEVVSPDQLHPLQQLVRRGGILEPVIAMRCALLLYHFIRHQLGHPVRSWQFLEQMGLVSPLDQ